MKKLPQGIELVFRARELGIGVEEGVSLLSGDFQRTLTPHEEADLQNRVMEVEKHLRQDRLWTLALVSSVAAVVSSVTALVALFWHK